MTKMKMGAWIINIFLWLRKRKGLMWLLLAVIVGLLALATSRISFVEDISSFLPNNTDNKRINEAYQKIAAANKIIVTISPASEEADEDLLTDAASRFAEILLASDSAGHVKEIIYEVDNEKISEVGDFVVKNLPYFLEEEDYALIDSLLQPQTIEDRLKADKELLLSPMGGFVRNVILNDPLHFSDLVLKNLEIFKQNDSYNTDNGFIFNDKGECIVTIASKYPVSETANNRLLADEIYSAANQTVNEYEGTIKIVPFGASLISITNAEQIKKDSVFAVSIALVLILALLFLFFRSAKPLFLIALSIAFGALFSLGTIALFNPTVSVIAIGTASIIFGIAINYPLHFLAHLKHQPSVERTLKEIVNPLLIGNITTVGAFLSLLFISSPAMHDLGLFSSLLLVGTIAFVLVFLPQFIAPRHCLLAPQSPASNRHCGLDPQSPELSGDSDLRRNDDTQKTHNDGYSFDKIFDFSPEKNKYIVLIFFIFTCVLFFFSFGVKFETNLHAINYMTAEQRTEMNKLIEANKGKGKTVYAVVEGATTEEALRNYEEAGITRHCGLDPQSPASNRHCGLAPQSPEFLGDSDLRRNDDNQTARNDGNRTGRNGSISGIGNFFPSRAMQAKKIERWNSFWEWNDGALHECSKKDLLVENVKHIAECQGFKADVFDGFTEWLNKDFQPQNFDYFAPIFTTMGENYFSIQNDKTLIYTILQLPNSFKSSTPPSNSSLFFFDDSSIAQKMVSALSDDFNNVLYICGFIVFVFLLFSFGRIELAILAFIPLTVGWIWILGLMNIFDIRFNIVNIILATFIFGQGDDYTIFVTEGLIYENAYGRRMLASFKKSIMLSATILFIAIGLLIFAQHPALRSLAELTVVGMISVVACAYLFPPLVFRFLTVKKGKRREAPWTLKRFLMMTYSFIVFLVGSLLLTACGWLWGGKLKYHKILCWTAKFVICRVPGVKFRCENLSDETFEKPAVIIANHQSHLDLMCLMMLTPRLIILTNDWVWRSPFYGRLIRYADFYPVSQGIENSIERLRGAVERGYSIVVFPEGTRSADCSISRFHRGAFYLAETLRLDIIPVFLHGVGHVLPKNDFLLCEGQITVQIRERIRLNDSRFAADYATRSKQVRKYYTDTFATICKTIETPEYFKHFVMYNYLYKGVEVWKGAKEELKELKGVKGVKELGGIAGRARNDGEQGIVLIENSGYGVFAFMYALANKDIEVITTEDDWDKVAVARNCAGKPDNLKIYHSSEWKSE
jgi:1-acyl-sn-glycerol-3-phosphate acyltransferase